MFCYQCEQTAKGQGCTVMGVCGKDDTTAALQDLLVYAAKGISIYAHNSRPFGVKNEELNQFILKALFTTVTNVNFDAQKISALIDKAIILRDNAKAAYQAACLAQNAVPQTFTGPAVFVPAPDLAGRAAQGEAIGIQKVTEEKGADLAGLIELVTYSLKGIAAYADHALVLGFEDDEVYDFFHKALAELTRPDISADDLLGLTLESGQANLKVMALLDQANTTVYGNPVPTQVRVTPIRGKAILVSGHDLKDLEELLKQTEGKGVNIYTHGEMLPAHAYPELKKYAHLVGNYGGAWQDQQKEFAAFPGSVLMTTNCIQNPRGYSERIFTSGMVEWPGVTHVDYSDFSAVIESALAQEGFTEDGPEQLITVGFGHNAVLSVAGPVIDAVKAGQIRHFFLIGGCDGAKAGRNYYTELAEKVPQDCVILTLACGKYRFNKIDFGNIGGIPRLLDMGQCNDAYSAIKVASALAEAFGTDVNGLPLSLVLSWYEQKAVCILCTLLALGIKNIRLGPSLPAFLTPAVVQILQEKFNIMPISTPEEDLKAILG